MPYETIRFKLFINKKIVMEEQIKSNASREAKERFVRPVDVVGTAFGYDCAYPHDKLPNRIIDDIISFWVDVKMK